MGTRIPRGRAAFSLTNSKQTPNQQDPGRAPISDPGEVSDESYPHRKTEGPGTPAGPARPGHRPGPGRSRGPRVPERRPGPDGLCRPTAMAGRLDGDPRGQDGPPRAGAH